MQHDITLDDLILYYYNETQLTENVLIQRAIDHDEQAACFFEAIQEAHQFLDQCLLSAPADCLRQIVAKARCAV
jgi:hypothetical protein